MGESDNNNRKNMLLWLFTSFSVLSIITAQSFGIEQQNVTIGTSPVFVTTPDSIVRAHLGGRIDLRCSAKGNPKPQTEWTNKQLNMIVSDSEQLNLEDLSFEDEGTYECIARNRFGLAAKEIRLEIVGSFSFPEHSMAVEEDEELNADIVTRNMTNYMEMVKTVMKYSNFETMFTIVNKTHMLTPVQQMIIANYTGCVGGTQAYVIDCDQYAHYRSITGICNNVVHPYWGSSVLPFRRLLPPNYEDNLAKPIGWFANRRYRGHAKPSVVDISKTLMRVDRVTNDPRHNHLLMQFGQFLDHDLAFTAVSRSVNLLHDYENIDCRHTCRLEPCFSIEYVTRHRLHDFAYQEECIELTRSAELCGSGFTSIVFGRVNAREQVNMLTAYLDGSNIYGSTPELSKYLRQLSPDRGRLKTIMINNETFPPLSNSEHHHMDCHVRHGQGFLDCLLAGDHRANEHIGLLIFHTIWLRHHNRLAAKLGAINPTWSGEKIYQVARSIVGAQLQLITYRDWLPVILGRKGMKMLGAFHFYDDRLDASISNVFATAAMRFGHTLVNSNLVRKPNSTMKLREAFFSGHLLLKPNISKTIVEGMMATPLKQPNPEQIINPELSQHMFESSRYVPLDLSAINIQRGRDHGLPGYNHWREFCRLGKAETFDDLKKEISNERVRRKLEQLYGHPDNIDLWVGAVLEDVPPDAKVGPTFRCLLVEQFTRLRDGDRYFFRNIFTPDQIRQIEKTSLAKIICDNVGGLTTIGLNAFQLDEDPVVCGNFDDLDLRLF